MDDEERTALNAARAAWVASVDRDDFEGDPRELMVSLALMMWSAGRDHERRQSADLIAAMEEAIKTIQETGDVLLEAFKFAETAPVHPASQTMRDLIAVRLGANGGLVNIWQMALSRARGTRAGG